MDFLPLPLGSIQMAENGTKWSVVIRGWVQCKICFPTYCEAVCILSESERQILERKGKKRRGISLE